jgi:hypothetical protein
MAAERDGHLAKIESDIRGFVRASYPDMDVHAEYWAQDPSRIALFFIEKRFEGLYRRQRYHYLLHLIPKDYYDSLLTNSVWFELTPDEGPETVADDPEEEIIASIAPDVLSVLREKRPLQCSMTRFVQKTAQNSPRLAQVTSVMQNAYFKIAS